MLSQKIPLELDYFPNKQDSNNDYLCFVVVVNKLSDDIVLDPLEIQRLYIQINNSVTNNRLHQDGATVRFSVGFITNSPTKRSKAKLNKDTLHWLEQLAVTTLRNLENHNFNAEFLSYKMNLSLRQLHRKLKQLTGMNPTQYLREARLQQARILLEHETYPMVKTVCDKIGMKDVKYFSKQFKKRFGQSPSAFLG